MNEAESTHRCNRCGLDLPEDSFGVHKGGWIDSTGARRRHQCKPCRATGWREDNAKKKQRRSIPSPPPPAPARFSDADRRVQMAIAQLKYIPSDDPERADAAKTVRDFLDANFPAVTTQTQIQ